MIFVCYRGWCDGSTPLTQTSTGSTIDNVIQLDCLNLSSMFMVQNEYSTKTEKKLSKIQNSQAKHQNKRSITFFEHPKISVYRCVGYYPFYVISWRWSLLWCIWYTRKITAETHFHFALVHFVFGVHINIEQSMWCIFLRRVQCAYINRFHFCRKHRCNGRCEQISKVVFKGLRIGAKE